MFGRRKDMRKENIARAGAAFVLLLALTGVTILGQDTETTSRAETPRKVVSVSKTKSNSEDTEKKSKEKQSAEASSNGEKEKQSEDKKQETEKVSATAIENKSESDSSKSDSNSENKNQGKTEKPSSGNSGSEKPSHKHAWTPQTTTINHPATGHNEQVLIKDAWTEYKPIYETVAIEVCGNCGADCTSDPAGHIKEHMLNGTGQYGTHTEYVQKQTGTETVTHPAEYTTKWIEDSPAWSEEVVTGYTCSCGASK